MSVWENQIILKCSKCEWLHIGVRAEEVAEADRARFSTCEHCGASGENFTLGTVEELPRGAGIRPRIIPAHLIKRAGAALADLGGAQPTMGDIPRRGDHLEDRG